MPRLLLIHPTASSVLIGFSNTESWGMPCLSLAQIAALTPGHWEKMIVDEVSEKIDFSLPVDLVGITTYTANVSRAYQIASQFKDKNVTVILGGVHASMLPEEAIQFADAVVVGEAESIWYKVITDFENSDLKKFYYGERLPLDHLVIPERKLYSQHYFMDVIQTSRGCALDCEFCSVRLFNGTQQRYRPIDEVLDEIEKIQKKVLYIIDDNFFGTGKKASQRALQFCRGLIERKIKKFWLTQVSLDLAEESELLKYAFKSGCRGVYIGIESVNLDNLKHMNKKINYKLSLRGIKKSIANFHKHGIAVCGSFIFGYDDDDILVIRDTLDFIQNSNLDSFDFNFLIPYPGTRLFNRLEKEGRLIYRNFPADWEKYENNNIVIIPKKMTISNLVRGVDYIIRKKLSIKAILLQMIKTLFLTRRLTSTILALVFNLSNRKIYNFEEKIKSLKKEPF